MPSTPKYRVIVHPIGRRWTWSQVSRNGSLGAVAPTSYDNKANAKRAGSAQVKALVWGFNAAEPAGSPLIDGPRVEGQVVPQVVLVVDEDYRRP